MTLVNLTHVITKKTCDAVLWSFTCMLPRNAEVLHIFQFRRLQ